MRPNRNSRSSCRCPGVGMSAATIFIQPSYDMYVLRRPPRRRSFATSTSCSACYDFAYKKSQAHQELHTVSSLPQPGVRDFTGCKERYNQPPLVSKRVIFQACMVGMCVCVCFYCCAYVWRQQLLFTYKQGLGVWGSLMTRITPHPRMQYICMRRPLTVHETQSIISATRRGDVAYML